MVKTIFVALLCFTLNIFAQIQSTNRGRVTYISSQHTYVQFDSTNNIEQGDTLYQIFNNMMQPVLRVEYKSSRSCACINISSIILKLNDELSYIIQKEINVPIQGNNKNSLSDAIKKDSVYQADTVKINANEIKNPVPINKVTGRISVQTYSTISNLPDDHSIQNWRYVLSGEDKNISGSNITLSSYLYFFYRADRWNEVSKSPGKNLRVYDLTATYSLNNNLLFRAGRFIDRRLSTIGSIDGIQFEKTWGNTYAGVTLGSRPDFGNFGYNAKLFQAGAYFGRNDSLINGVMENIFAFIHQTNNFKTDRQFLYFQHSSNLSDKFNFFMTTEIDLYKKEGGKGKSNLNFTSFYILSRYTPSRPLTFSISYDARKRIIYYESFKDFSESFLENNIRHSVRFNMSIRPMNNLSVGLNSGYMYQKNDIRPSRNFGGYLSYFSIPLLKISSVLNYTKSISSYTEWDNLGISFNKDLFEGLMYLSAAYRYADYSYMSGSFKSIQNIFTIDCSVRISTSIYSSINYEGVFEKKSSYGRIGLELTGRFN